MKIVVYTATRKSEFSKKSILVVFISCTCTVITTKSKEKSFIQKFSNWTTFYCITKTNLEDIIERI